MLSPSESGIRGNSHMIVQNNSLQIANLILRSIDERVTFTESGKMKWSYPSRR